MLWPHIPRLMFFQKCLYIPIATSLFRLKASSMHCTERRAGSVANNTFSHTTKTMNMTPPSAESEILKYTHALYASYEAYEVKEVASRRLKHASLMNLLDALLAPIKHVSKIEQIGASSEGRSIKLLTIGSGKKKIFMWSQMHGDEPTATMGVLDMLSYIGKNQSAPEVKQILSETTLLIVPMLNPDGAERFQRRSVHGIDINRDALQLQTNEARMVSTFTTRNRGILSGPLETPPPLRSLLRRSITRKAKMRSAFVRKRSRRRLSRSFLHSSRDIFLAMTIRSNRVPSVIISKNGEPVPF